MADPTVNPDGSPVVTPGTTYHPEDWTGGGTGGGGGGTGDVTTTQLNAAVALLQDKATAATDAELSDAVATLNTALAAKQAAATAATDAEVAAAVATLQSAATAATDAELQAAVDTLNTALAGKQDAATAATDQEVATGRAADRLMTATVWTPNTVYVAGQWIITPGGYLASAKVNFTSGAVYDAANWDERMPGAEVGYSENITGTTYPLTTVTTGLAGVSIVAPVSPRPMYLHFGTWVDVTTTAAAGTTGTAGINVTDEAAVLYAGDIVSFESADSLGYAQAQSMCRIPPNTPSHTYSLVANRAGNGTFRAQILHGAISPAFRTFMALIAA